jgi:hypothetical protein
LATDSIANFLPVSPILVRRRGALRWIIAAGREIRSGERAMPKACGNAAYPSEAAPKVARDGARRRFSRAAAIEAAWLLAAALALAGLGAAPARAQSLDIGGDAGTALQYLSFPDTPNHLDLKHFGIAMPLRRRESRRSRTLRTP